MTLSESSLLISIVFSIITSSRTANIPPDSGARSAVARADTTRTHPAAARRNTTTACLCFGTRASTYREPPSSCSRYGRWTENLQNGNGLDVMPDGLKGLQRHRPGRVWNFSSSRLCCTCWRFSQCLHFTRRVLHLVLFDQRLHVILNASHNLSHLVIRVSSMSVVNNVSHLFHVKSACGSLVLNNMRMIE